VGSRHVRLSDRGISTRRRRGAIDPASFRAYSWHDAICDGVDLRGLFVWALMDTYEFNLGYSTKFGLIRIDYETQRRTIKDSGYWYRDVMVANGF
jgi:beta-glucosidase/6-phospho-beta-glucosidase/beta-galactosidase